MKRSLLGSLLGAVTLGLTIAWGLLAWSTDATGLALAVVTALLAGSSVLSVRRIRRVRRRQQETAQAITDSYLATIEALAGAIEAREERDASHVGRVQRYAVALAERVGLSETDIESVRLAALLHDIGMLAVPEHILSKTTPLTEEEFDRVRHHARAGADLIERVAYPRPVAPLIRSHHERWDGLGYPDGLSGEDIPIGARILNLAEVFDALTSDRPYHKAMSRDAALGLLRQESGRGMDPTLVDRFVELLPELDRVTETPATPEPGSPGDAPEGDIYQQIARAHHEVYALYELSSTLGRSLSVTEGMALIADKLKPLVPYSCCALFLQDPDGTTLRCRFVAGTDADVIERVVVKPGEGLAGWVAQTRRPLVNASPRLDTVEITTLESALVTPLIFQDRFIGTLAVYHEQSDFYTEDHCRLLLDVADQTAAVVANSLLFDQTQEDSLTDPLTTLPNTRSLFMHLTRELARAERLQSGLALLVIDMNDFKQINDRHGHHMGDRALCEVARVLRSVIRPYDICGRYAGDEFILVLSGCSEDEAQRRKEDVQRSIKATTLETGGQAPVTLGASVGVAMFPADGDTYESLLAAADRRMYQDKTREKHRAAGHEILEGKSYTDDELKAAGSGVL